MRVNIKPIQSLAMSLPPSAARVAKRIGVYPRYRNQLRLCREGYAQYGKRYPQTTLFIAGLPKSGTTWLERMVSSYPGFHEILIPDVAKYELETGGSHDYELPSDIFSRFDQMLVLTKMHVHGSENNVRLLHEANVNYVVLYRDLRDVAISHFHYVRQTPWHPEYPLYIGLSLHEGLALFAERTLEPFAQWVYSWHDRRDTKRSIMTSYEALLSDPVGVMTQVATLFELDNSPETVQSIVDKHSFKRLSGGRQRGESDKNSFFRKGVAGDWVNHFTPELKALYKEKIGRFLIDFGYEEHLSSRSKIN